MSALLALVTGCSVMWTGAPPQHAGDKPCHASFDAPLYDVLFAAASFGVGVALLSISGDRSSPEGQATRDRDRAIAAGLAVAGVGFTASAFYGVYRVSECRDAPVPATASSGQRARSERTSAAWPSAW